MSEISERIFFHFTNRNNIPRILSEGLLPYNKAKVDNVNRGGKNLVYFGSDPIRLEKYYGEGAIIVAKISLEETLIDEDLIYEIFKAVSMDLRKKNRKSITIHIIRSLILRYTIIILRDVIDFEKMSFKIKDLIISMLISLFCEKRPEFSNYVNPQYTMYKVLRITKGYAKEFRQMSINKPITFEGKNKILVIIDSVYNRLMYVAPEVRGSKGLEYFQRKATYKESLFYYLSICLNKDQFGYKSLDRYEFDTINGKTVMKKLSLPELAKKYFSSLSAKLQQSIIRNSPEVEAPSFSSVP